METPTIQIDLNNQGQIQKIHGDLRFYEPLVNRYHAPPLTTILALKRAATLLPNGNPAIPDKPYDKQPIVWFAELRDQTMIRLRCYSPGANIDITVDPQADRTNPKNHEVRIGIIFTKNDEYFSDLLLDVCHYEDLTQCRTNFEERNDDPPYINDVAKIVEITNDLRRQLDRSFQKLMATPLPDDEEESQNA